MIVNTRRTRADESRMGGNPGPPPTPASAAIDRAELAAVLRELDAARDREGAKWVDKRHHERRPVRLEVVVYHVFSATGTVRAVAGCTRDLSQGGAGLVCTAQFRRHEQIVVALTLPSGEGRRLTGCVVYSRPVRPGWFLTGVKFGPVADERLAPAQLEQVAPAPAADTATPQSGGAEKTTPTPSPRDQALRLLNEGSSGWRMSTDKIAKVLDYSRSADPVVRRATIPALMQIGGVKAGGALRALLEDTNPEIQAEAADAAGQMGLADAAEQLAELLKSKSELVAISAAEALGRLGDRRGLRLAAEYLVSDRPLNRRAARAVGVIVGQDFRPNSEGLTAARAYLKQHSL